MASKQENRLKIAVGVVSVVLVVMAGAWIWALRKAGAVRSEASAARDEIKKSQDKIQEIQEELVEFNRSGWRDYYKRMLPDRKDFLWVHDLRLFDEIEREAGIHILKGELDKKKAATSKKEPYEEVVLNMEIAADFAGLVRFLEGLENEVDRDPTQQGGRLFEIREIKTMARDESAEEKGAKEEEATKFVFPPGWRRIGVKLAYFALREKS